MKPETAQAVYEERERLDALVSDAQNITHALQMVLWDVCQMRADEPIGEERRGALVGLGDAFERLLGTRPATNPPPPHLPGFTIPKPEPARPIVSPTGLYDAQGCAVNAEGHRIAADGSVIPF